MSRTSSIDNEVPGLASNHDRRDVGDILVSHRARADGIDVDRGADLSVDLANAGLAFLDDGLDRTCLDDVLQGENGCFGPRLKWRCRNGSRSGKSESDSEEHLC